jgi:hypothetical protein
MQALRNVSVQLPRGVFIENCSEECGPSISRAITTSVSPLKSTSDPARKLPPSDIEQRMPLRREAKQTSHSSWRSNPSAVPGAEASAADASPVATPASDQIRASGKSAPLGRVSGRSPPPSKAESGAPGRIPPLPLWQPPSSPRKNGAKKQSAAPAECCAEPGHDSRNPGRDHPRMVARFAPYRNVRRPAATSPWARLAVPGGHQTTPAQTQGLEKVGFIYGRQTTGLAFFGLDECGETPGLSFHG